MAERVSKFKNFSFSFSRILTAPPTSPHYTPVQHPQHPQHRPTDNSFEDDMRAATIKRVAEAMMRPIREEFRRSPIKVTCAVTGLVVGAVYSAASWYELRGGYLWKACHSLPDMSVKHPIDCSGINRQLK